MQQLFDIRLAMLASGYVIIPVIGKKPPLEGWQNVKSASREVLEAWERDYPVASNTGILTRFTPTFDIDLRNELAALAVENMSRYDPDPDRLCAQARNPLSHQRAIQEAGHQVYRA